jgi:hypothetical protein
MEAIKMRLLALMILSLMIVSCSNKNTTTVSKYYEDGRSRPIVSIAPVVDSSSYELPWSLSEEFTSLIRANLSKNKSIFLADTDDVANNITSLDNPFNPDISWMRDRFDQNEFVVFLELVKHTNAKVNKATNLDMIMRVKVIDVRGKQPKVVLQENVTDKYYIEKGTYKSDYSNVRWGSREFQESRMGMAHMQLAKDIAARISEYVSLSKSR